MKILSIYKRELAKQDREIAHQLLGPVFIPRYRTSRQVRAKDFIHNLARGIRTLPGTPISITRLVWPGKTPKETWL